jgi:hypothetical protein
VEISKKLYEELLKLNKSEWDKLEMSIDFLYCIGLNKKEYSKSLKSFLYAAKHYHNFQFPF